MKPKMISVQDLHAQMARPPKPKPIPWDATLACHKACYGWLDGDSPVTEERLERLLDQIEAKYGDVIELSYQRGNVRVIAYHRDFPNNLPREVREKVERQQALQSNAENPPTENYESEAT